MSGGLVIGAGCSHGCPAAELAELVRETLHDVEGDPVALATVDSRAAEPCMVAAAETYRVPLRTHAPGALAEVAVPTPSEVVAAHVGTASVAEAAALLSAGPHPLLVVAKRRSAHATCAIAREQP